MTEKEIKKRKEQILKFMKEPGYVPMRKRDIAALFRVPAEEKEDLAYVLELLLQDGSLTMDTRGRYHVEDALVLQGDPQRSPIPIYKSAMGIRSNKDSIIFMLISRPSIIAKI